MSSVPGGAAQPFDEHLDLIDAIGALSDDDPSRCVREGSIALGVVGAAGDEVAEMRLSCHLGFAHYLLAHDAPALEAAERSLALARQHGDRSWEAKSLALLGSVHGGFGDNSSAIDLLEQALVIRRELTDAYGTAVALNNLADTYIEMRRFLDRARTLLLESHELFVSVGSPEALLGAAISLATLAELAMVESEQDGRSPEAAAASARDALVHARASLAAAAVVQDRPRTVAIARLVEARALVVCGRPDEAERSLAEVWALGGITSTPYFQIMGGMQVGRILALRGENEAAAREIEATLLLTDDTPRMTERVQLLSDLVAVHVERGAFAEALEAHQRLFHATLEQRDDVAERRGRVLNARLDVERAQLAAEVSRLRSEQLESDNRSLAYDALHDALTGLANRRDFDETLAARAAHPATAFTLVLTDLDRFKQVNDTFSHPVGDLVLRQVAQLIGSCVRGTDLVARIGGEEIAVLLASTPEPCRVGDVCERIRATIEEHPWGELAAGLTVTISIGAASRRPGESATELVARTDELLYEAKRRGRNRVVART